MENNKSSGNRWLTKEFYITFWNEVKILFLLAIVKASLVNHLSALQKRTRQKLYSKQLLNVDVKLISKALAKCLKISFLKWYLQIKMHI